jgi:glutamyl-Q tRNA(Asp) synthetase
MDLTTEQLIEWGVNTFELKQVPQVAEIQISQ